MPLAFMPRLLLLALSTGPGATEAMASPLCFEADVPVPLPSAPGPLEKRAVSIAVDHPITKPLQPQVHAYPQAEYRQTRGTLTLLITIDGDGRVAEVRRPFSPDYSVLPRLNGELLIARPLGSPFVETAEEMVRGWRYEKPRRAPISLFVRLSFSPEQATSIVWHHAARPPVPQSQPFGVRSTPLLSPECPVRIGDTVDMPRKTKHVPPTYPPAARSANVQGVVIVETTIRSDGKVGNARVLRSVPLLDQAALDAVRQWEFKPTFINGRAVSVIMEVVVEFKSSHLPASVTVPAPTPPLLLPLCLGPLCG